MSADQHDDLRQRMSSLARALLVLDGSALAISIMIFVSGGAPDLLPGEIQLLRLAWWILCGSIAASTGVLFAMLFSRWRTLGLALNIAAFVAFLLGLALLVAVSASALGVSTDDYVGTTHREGRT